MTSALPSNGLVVGAWIVSVQYGWLLASMKLPFNSVTPGTGELAFHWIWWTQAASASPPDRPEWRACACAVAAPPSAIASVAASAAPVVADARRQPTRRRCHTKHRLSSHHAPPSVIAKGSASTYAALTAVGVNRS